MKIPFNIPFVSGNENIYTKEVFGNLPIKDTHRYIDRCRTLLKRRWDCNDLFLTNSCTSALEVCALLLNIKHGDEVIIPSYTFPSTANAFLRQGAKIILADSRSDYPGIDEKKLEALITERTKVIVPVHYAGIASDMDQIMKVAERYNLYIVEDAAAAFDSSYKSRQLGSIGHLGCLSFHQTKNIHCEEGGAILINDNRFLKRVINILEKGTNRNELTTNNIERYEWVDIGSSFMMTELHAAYLYAQLEKADLINERRQSLWGEYYNSLKILHKNGVLKIPFIPDYADHNSHAFYVLLNNPDSKDDLKRYLSGISIQATVHYTSLNHSKYWKGNNSKITENPNSTYYNDCLLRLPLYNTMTTEEVTYVTASLLKYFNY